MRGTVKWFNGTKGYGFITDSDGKDHFFHHSSIQMDGFRVLNEDDIVEFEIGQCTNGKTQAVNVQPILTRKDVGHALKKERLVLRVLKKYSGNGAYMVADACGVIQAGEQGMSLIEVAKYAGIDTSEEEKEN